MENLDEQLSMFELSRLEPLIRHFAKMSKKTAQELYGTEVPSSDDLTDCLQALAKVGSDYELSNAEMREIKIRIYNSIIFYSNKKSMRDAYYTPQKYLNAINLLFNLTDRFPRAVRQHLGSAKNVFHFKYQLQQLKVALTTLEVSLKAGQPRGRIIDQGIQNMNEVTNIILRHRGSLQKEVIYAEVSALFRAALRVFIGKSQKRFSTAFVRQHYAKRKHVNCF